MSKADHETSESSREDLNGGVREFAIDSAQIGLALRTVLSAPYEKLPEDMERLLMQLGEATHPV